MTHWLLNNELAKCGNACGLTWVPCHTCLMGQGKAEKENTLGLSVTWLGVKPHSTRIQKVLLCQPTVSVIRHINPDVLKDCNAFTCKGKHFYLLLLTNLRTLVVRWIPSVKNCGTQRIYGKYYGTYLHLLRNHTEYSPQEILRLPRFNLRDF